MAAQTGTDGVAGLAPPVLAVGLVAVGHVGALLVLPATPSLTAVASFEAAVLTLLVAATALTRGVDRQLAVTAVTYAVATAGAWAVIASGTGLLVAAVGLVLLLVVLGYGLHRYELVALGLVEET